MSGNSGVRNLRAMFENQNSAASPEPRGRSPAGSDEGAPRPSSNKVRASFVSVEPNGPPRDVGTAKGVSVNSMQANRRESFSVSEEAGEATVAELKKVVSDEKEERRKSVAIEEAIPEQAVDTEVCGRSAHAVW